MPFLARREESHDREAREDDDEGKMLDGHESSFEQPAPPRPLRNPARTSADPARNDSSSASDVGRSTWLTPLAISPQIKHRTGAKTPKRPSTAPGPSNSAGSFGASSEHISRKRIPSPPNMYGGYYIDGGKIRSSPSKSSLLAAPSGSPYAAQPNETSQSSAALSRRKSLDHPPSSAVKRTGIFTKTVFTPKPSPKAGETFFGSGIQLFMDTGAGTSSDVAPIDPRPVAGPSTLRPTSPNSVRRTPSHPPTSMRFPVESPSPETTSTATVTRKNTGMSRLLSKASKGALALGLGHGRHVTTSPRRVSSPPIRQKLSMPQLGPSPELGRSETPTPMVATLGVTSSLPSGFNDLRFSTLDRTILEQLKITLAARQSQFVMKGPLTPRENASLDSDLKSAGAGGLYNGSSGAKGTRHHAFPTKEVPYPRNYDSESMDLETWETLVNEQSCDSVTWHVFEEDPPKVLDIGCGAGTWVLNAARQWPTSHFVGLDIVPLQPDLRSLSYPTLAERITFTQANFLEGLPFSTEEFDFVHIKRIARGVPEDKWDDLFEEVLRVLKPGGAFELYDEDLFFPGKALREDGEDGSDDSGDSSYGEDDSAPPCGAIYPDGTPTDSAIFMEASRSELKLIIPRSHPPDGADIAFPLSAAPVTSPISEEFENHTSSTPLFRRRPRSQSQIPDPHVPQRRRSISQVQHDKPLPPPPNTAPISSEKQHGEKATSGFASSSSELSSEPSQSSSMGASALRLIQSLSPLDNGGSSSRRSEHRRSFTVDRRPMIETTKEAPHFYHHNTFRTTSTPGRDRGQQRTLTLPSSSSPSSFHPPPSLIRPPRSATRIMPSPAPVEPPVLLRTLPKPPLDPREHRLLEKIYDEMHADRFINLAPLPLLRNCINNYFKNVKTHPSVFFAFPSKPQLTPKPSITEIPRGRSLDRSLLSMSQSSLKHPHPQRPLEPNITRGNELVESLVAGTLGFAAIDQGQFSIPAPAATHEFQARQAASSPLPAVFSRTSTPIAEHLNARAAATTPTPGPAPLLSLFLQPQLPNTHLYFEAQWAHQHLALKTAEVIGCAEAMWEWVLEQQKQAQSSRGRARAGSTGGGRTGPGPSRTSVSSNSTAEVKETLETQILQLTRSEFDTLLTNFDLDMRDHINVKHTLEQTFNWSTIATTETEERKAFNTACEKWDAWVAQQREARRPHSKGYPSAKNGGRGKPSRNTTPRPRHSRCVQVFCAWKP